MYVVYKISKTGVLVKNQMISKKEIDIIKKWKGNIAKPTVSIKCTAFNHEKYISNALDSFLIQETTFPFEIVVHDDASTDNTAKIIKEYENRYPHIIKPIYEIENQYSKGDDSLTKSINSKLKGKYVALCEGDDFWIDKHKLQKQYDALQNNKKCSLCVHKTKVVKEDGATFLYEMPKKKIKKGVVNQDDCSDTLFFHTSSCFMTKESYDTFNREPYIFRDEGRKIGVEDAPLFFYYSYFENIFYIDEYMSIYRRFADNSWTKRNTSSDKTYINTAVHFISMFKNMDEISNYKYHNSLKKVMNYYNFGIYYRQNKYKELIKEEYRNVLFLFPLYKRIMIYIGCIFPSFTNCVKELYYKCTKD